MSHVECLCDECEKTRGKSNLALALGGIAALLALRNPPPPIISIPGGSSSSGVQSVTALNTTITVGGTAAGPVLSRSALAPSPALTSGAGRWVLTNLTVNSLGDVTAVSLAAAPAGTHYRGGASAGLAAPFVCWLGSGQIYGYGAGLAPLVPLCYADAIGTCYMKVQFVGTVSADFVLHLDTSAGTQSVTIPAAVYTQAAPFKATTATLVCDPADSNAGAIFVSAHAGALSGMVFWEVVVN